ncbi:MAG: BamA/TamA family outer membrane protein [Spartobacteria bacterium]
MKRFALFTCCFVLAANLLAQNAANVERDEKDKEKKEVEKAQEQKAQHTSVIEFSGARVFTEKELRSHLKEQITTIDNFGLTSARADDAAFFLELFYRKHGYSHVSVRYKIESGDHLRLEVDEGDLTALGEITFEGNAHEPTEKLFEYAVGPTRERFSKLQKQLPYVAADVEEGADLIKRFYVAEGFLNVVIDPPFRRMVDNDKRVDVTLFVHEGERFTFGNVSFTGKTVYDAETLRGQIKDLLEQPYTDARVADIPRRLQSYFKTRGYFDVKVDAIGNPTGAVSGRVPVQVVVASGPIYHFGEASVTGLTRLRPTYVTKRFSSLSGKTYSPEVLDEKFRTLMRTGLFNLLQIKPVAVDGSLLRLDITAEEAKSKEFGLSAGYGTYEGLIGGVQFRERDLFGLGRPLTTSVEVSQRSYKGEVLYEDPFFLDTENAFKARIGALSFDYDGYSKFEIGGLLELSRKITKQYEAGVQFGIRHVEVTSTDINLKFLGLTSYFINTLGFTHTFDLRESPLVNPRGLILNNTVDVATAAFGSEVDLIRVTLRGAYYIPFGPKELTPGVVVDRPASRAQRFWQQSSLAFGGRVGVVHSLTNSGGDEPAEIPIDERFFNGGGTSVRSFAERDLGPHDRHGHPVGGEFYTVFNAEYTFPIFGELQGAVFADAGNLLPTSEEPGLDDLRYALGAGLRYKLPIGPIRFDYGVNPDRRGDEDFGAFHFSFGFAF